MRLFTTGKEMKMTIELIRLGAASQLTQASGGTLFREAVTGDKYDLI